MIVRKFIVLFWAFLLAIAPLAGEEHRAKVAVDDAGNGSFSSENETRASVCTRPAKRAS